MTVKIIVPGILPEEKIITGKCLNCKCSFTFNPPDAKLVLDTRDGDYYSIACPTCGYQCTVSEGGI
jgi:hypothetical protein